MAKRKIRRKNSAESYDGAIAVAEGFHGRASKEEIDIAETLHYDKDVAQLGLLCELEILMGDDDEVTPISFPYEDEKDPVRLCGTSDRRQLLLIGGDQDLNECLLELGVEEDDLEKRSLVIGDIFSISYYSDKHHLAGGGGQELGVEYQHEFGEEGGELPQLVYHPKGKRMEISGGSYEIRDEGIWD